MLYLRTTSAISLEWMLQTSHLFYPNITKDNRHTCLYLERSDVRCMIEEDWVDLLSASAYLRIIAANNMTNRVVISFGYMFRIMVSFTVAKITF